MPFVERNAAYQVAAYQVAAGGGMDAVGAIRRGERGVHVDQMDRFAAVHLAPRDAWNGGVEGAGGGLLARRGGMIVATNTSAAGETAVR